MSAAHGGIRDLLPASAVHALGALGARIDGYASGYSLRRIRGGTEVWLHVGKLSINLSIHLRRNPLSFAEAREWMTQISGRLGYTVPERRKRPPVVLRVIQGGKPA